MMQMNEAAGSARGIDTRIREIDIVKAIGIICVFVGHRTWGSPVNRFIYLFHMSFFFILSGFMIRDGSLSLKQILSKELKLFASYLLYSLLFILIDAIRAEAVPEQDIIHTLGRPACECFSSKTVMRNRIPCSSRPLEIPRWVDC